MSASHPSSEPNTLCGKTREGPGALLCCFKPGHTGPCSWEGARTSNPVSTLTQRAEEGMRLRHAAVEQATDKLGAARDMAYLSHLDRGELLVEIERLRARSRIHTACHDNVGAWEYPHLVICFNTVKDLNAAQRWLSNSPEAAPTPVPQPMQDWLTASAEAVIAAAPKWEGWANGAKDRSALITRIKINAIETRILRFQLELDALRAESTESPEADSPSFEHLLPVIKANNWWFYGDHDAAMAKSAAVESACKHSWLELRPNDGPGVECDKCGEKRPAILNPEKAADVTPGLCCCNWDKTFDAILHRDRTCSVHGDVVTQVNGSRDE